MAAETDTLLDQQCAAPARRETVVSDVILDNSDLVDRIFEFIVVEFPDMRERAEELKQMARREFAGIEMYIPRRSQADRDQVVRDVLRLFDGRNAAEVGRRLHLSRATVYRIIKTSGRSK